MVTAFSSKQMDTLQSRHAEAQLERAALDLHAQAERDFSLQEVRAALDKTAENAVPLGIMRIKWLKALTLMHLYPAAAPDPKTLGDILRDEDRPQDDRMRAAIAAAAQRVEGIA